MRKWAVLVLMLGSLLAALLPLLVRRGVVPQSVMIGLSLTVVAAAVLVFNWLVFAGHSGQRGSRAADGPVLYQDRLVTITATHLVLQRYSLLGKSRSVPFTGIEVVRALAPTLWNGKWRLQGSSDLHTYFPMDWKRPTRDTIFLAIPKEKGGYQIGFTVEDSTQVRKVLSEVGLLQPICLKCGYDLRGNTGPCPECGTARS